MGWVSKKVYAILQNAKREGDVKAYFVDDIPEMNWMELKKALDDFFNDLSTEKYEKYLDGNKGYKKSESTNTGDVPNELQSANNVINVGEYYAKQEFLGEDNVNMGMLNSFLGIDKPITQEDVDALAKEIGYGSKMFEDALNEFNYYIEHPDECTMISYRIKMPDGTYEEAKAYNVNNGFDWVKKRREQGKQYIANEIAKQKSQNAIQYDNQVYIVLGLPGAGKSSSIANPIKDKYGTYEIDSDIFKEYLPESHQRNASGFKKNNASMVHEESGFLRDEFTNQVMNDKVNDKLPNLVVPMVGGSERSIMKRVEKFRETGYEINIINAYVTTKNGLKRNGSRFTNAQNASDKSARLVGPIEYYLSNVGEINKAFETVIGKYPDSFKSWAVYDGNGKFREPSPIVDCSKNWVDVVIR